MFTVSGFAYPELDVDAPRDDVPLAVISAGHHVLIQNRHVEVSRPAGRRDYQLIYIQSGSGHYTIQGKTRIVTKGHIVLYHPYESQHYYHELADSPDIYWLHFSGHSVPQFLEDSGLADERVYDVGHRTDYSQAIDQVIQELQLKRHSYRQLSNHSFAALLYLMGRRAAGLVEGQPLQSEAVKHVLRIFHSDFGKPFNIEEYAARYNVSARWFAQQFREQIGISPYQYLTDIRISKARELLGTSVSISEISAIVGYQDPLYFSRIFKKHTGLSPRKYHQKLLGEEPYEELA